MTVSTVPSAETLVDYTALRVNQAIIITLLVLGYLFDSVWLVAFVAAVMAVGTLWPGGGLFKLIYQHLLKPLGWVKADPRREDYRPHLFAQGLGSLVLMLALAALWEGALVLGWLLVGFVVVLAAVNLFAGFCLGCFVYYQLARRGIVLALPVWKER